MCKTAPFIQYKQPSPECESSKQEDIYFELVVKSEGESGKVMLCFLFLQDGGWQQGWVPPSRCEHTSGI